MTAEADLDGVIDSSRLGRFQGLVIALCALMVMIDGFDTQVIGMVAPSIAAAWNVPSAAFGPVFGLGLFGGLLGVVILGSASDRFGRKPVLVSAILLFAGVSLLTPVTTSLTELSAVRFVAGFGMGGALPGLIAITSEYSPKAVRANVTALMYCGFPLGSVLAGVVSAQMVPRSGWQSVFYVGSLVPLGLLPVFAWIVPESLRFLVARGDHGQVAKILARMSSGVSWNGKVAQARHGQRSRVGRLFTDGRAMGTASLWAVLFLSLLLTVFLVSWLPLVARSAGIDIRSSVLAVSALNLGGIVGCYVIGRLRNRFGSEKPIALGYAFGAVGVALIGWVGHSGLALLVAALLAGMLSVGAQMCAIGLSATFYDTSLRATGVGWALGSGRAGAVVGPIIGGVLISAGLSTPALFLVAGGVSLAAGLAVFSMGFATRRVAPDAVEGVAGESRAAPPGRVSP
ncbi:MAG: transporter, family, 4-hydroxybenzoate transporter [Gammaproteobacteria bacterium]|nr:transporter, family, 4-hydroxybenzoate transporter [Gammaproteobacteria bacterium]